MIQIDFVLSSAATATTTSSSNTGLHFKENVEGLLITKLEATACFRHPRCHEFGTRTRIRTIYVDAVLGQLDLHHCPLLVHVENIPNGYEYHSFATNGRRNLRTWGEVGRSNPVQQLQHYVSTVPWRLTSPHIQIWIRRYMWEILMANPTPRLKVPIVEE